MTRIALHFIAALLLVVAQSSVVSAQNAFAQEVDSIVELSSAKGYDMPIVFIGSSSISMWKTLEQDFAGLEVLNHGFGGSQFKDLLLYQDQLIERFEPSMLVIYCGDNDIANGADPERVAEDADRLADGFSRVSKQGLVLLLSVKPSPARWELKEKYQQLNGKLKAMADQYEHVVYIDVWTPMLKKNGEPDAKLFLEDGLHMNGNGYTIWKNALLPYLSK